jgi:hypothetical protein
VKSDSDSDEGFEILWFEDESLDPAVPTGRPGRCQR